MLSLNHIVYCVLECVGVFDDVLTKRHNILECLTTFSLNDAMVLYYVVPVYNVIPGYSAPFTAYYVVPVYPVYYVVHNVRRTRSSLRCTKCSLRCQRNSV